MNEKHATVEFAHDYFSQRGGAERVAIALIELLSPEVIYTACCNEYFRGLFGGRRHIKVSFINRFKVFRNDPRFAIFLLPFAWRRFEPATCRVIFCSSSGWAHGIRAKSGCKKIVYCHNPPRWVYQASDYAKGLGMFAHLGMSLIRPMLKYWDQRAASSVDVYIANSSSVAKRIEQAYGRKSIVIHPPVTINSSVEEQSVPGISPGYYLTVSRPRGYKGTDALIKAFALIPDQRLVIVGGDVECINCNNVTSLGFVSEKHLKWLYKNAKALISVSKEDFGLTPVEANAFGTPTLLLRAGGFIDSMAEGVSGMFIESDAVSDIVCAVREFPDQWDRSKIVAHAQKFSIESFNEKIQQVINSQIAV